MIVSKINNFIRGWFIGNFEPSLFKTDNFEVGYLTHKKGEKWPKHYHKESVEINYLIKGKMLIQNKELNSGDLFMFEKGEVADPIFLQDCELIVVKVPSIPNDKYLVE
jgi:quercetin dioxygenase-like cupin family protein